MERIQGGGVKMKVILDLEQINKVLDDLADVIAAEAIGDVDIVVVGIRSRGEIIGRRLTERLSERLGREVENGVLDITLYRDDLNSPQGTKQHLVQPTEIGFNIDDKVIILADDVLFTGRSARAAMDALTDLGRPRAIRLAVMVERAGRELPIQADYSGYCAEVCADERVSVRLVESDGVDEVVIE